MKQRLTSFDVPTPPPASLSAMCDLSHAVETYKPGKDYTLEDIPGLPMIRKDGKFRRFVKNRKSKKRITSMPILTSGGPTKDLPDVPNRSISNYNRFSMPALQEDDDNDDFEYIPQYDSRTLRTLDTVDTFNSESRPAWSCPINEDPATGSPPVDIPTNHSHYDNIITAGNKSLMGSCPSNGSTTSGSLERRYIIDDDDEDIDSLFSHKSASTQPVSTECADEFAAKSILDIVEIYEHDSEESDVGSVYTAQSRMSDITTQYINEGENYNNENHDIISVKDSLFSDTSDQSKIDVVDMNRFNNSRTSVNKNSPAIPNFSGSCLSLNKDLPSIDSTPIFNNKETNSSSSLQKETPISVKPNNMSKSSVNSNKELPTPPLNIKKTRNKVNFDETSLMSPSKPSRTNHNSPGNRHSSYNPKPCPTPMASFNQNRPASMTLETLTQKPPRMYGMLRHRNSYSKPVSMYDQRPVSMNLDSYRGVSNERPLSEVPDHVMGSHNSSHASFMSSTSLQEAKKELKQQVRQRPFSYCLDTPNDYCFTRYAAPITKPSGNPYRSFTQPEMSKRYSEPSLQSTHIPNSPATPVTPETSTAASFPATPETPNYPETPTTPNVPETPQRTFTLTIPRDFATTPKTSEPSKVSYSGSLPKGDYYRSYSQPHQTFAQKLTSPPSPPKQSKEETTKNRIAQFLNNELKGKRTSSVPIQKSYYNLYY